MSAVDDLLSHPDDKTNIGLLLCKTKNNVVAEYSLRGFSKPIGIAEWETEIVRSLPEEFAAALPSIEVLEAELADGTGSALLPSGKEHTVMPQASQLQSDLA